MSENEAHNPRRKKIPGIKREYLKIPAVVDNVEEWLCVKMHIPDDDDYIRQFYDLFDTFLGMWFNYQRTGEQEGARVAKIWRHARQTIQLDNCSEGVTVTACNPTPIGSIMMWPTTGDLPYGWLECRGQSVLVADYPELFEVIGYSFGGATLNFSLPDFRGRSPIGHQVTPVTYVVGGHYGTLTQTLTAANLPPHYHDIDRRDNSAFGSGARVATASGAGTQSTQQSGTNPGQHTSTPISILHPTVGIMFIMRALNEDCEGGTVIEGPPGPPGPIGPPGPQGVSGADCEDCGNPAPEDDGGNDVPPPIPGVDNIRCRVAQGVVDNLLDIYYIPLLDFFIESFITNGLNALELIEALRLTLIGQTAGAIAWPPSAIGLIGTIGSALFGAMTALVDAAQAQNLLDTKNELNEEETRELMYCLLFNLLDADGNITADVWKNFLDDCDTAGNFAVAFFSGYLRANMPLYAVRTEAYITEGGDFDCAECGWCYLWNIELDGSLADWTIINGTLPGGECGTLEGTHIRTQIEFVTPVDITQLRWFISGKTSAFSPFRIYINDQQIWQGLIRNGEQGTGGNFANVTKIVMDGVSADNFCVDGIRLRGKGTNPFGSSNCV